MMNTDCENVWWITLETKELLQSETIHNMFIITWDTS